MNDLSAQPPLERPLRWVFGNLVRLALYLAVAAVSSAAVLELQNVTPFLILAGYMFVVGGAYCLPGLALWLLILSRIPPEWGLPRRRFVAIATAPLVGLILFVLFAYGGSYWFALIFGVLWPMGAGLVVKLRQREGPALESSG